MRIGALTLQSNLFLSPLAGYTNLPFRLVVREIGGVGLCTTDLVNARSLLEKNKNAFKLIETRPRTRPWPRNSSAPCPKKCAMRRP
jgi:tRNA-dihydrouridine synthase B